MSLSTTNISTTLVSQTIGDSSGDVGTLCTSPSINKWSKYKPISYNSVLGIYGTSGTDTTILASVNYGLSVYSSDVPTTAFSNEWTYNRPQGGSTSPYRLGDFRNYNHTANPPISEPGANSEIINKMYVNTYDFNYLFASESDISVDLLTNINEYYLGILATTSSITSVCTSVDRIKDSGSFITIDLTAQPFDNLGTWDYYSLIFQTPRTQNAAIGVNNYYPLPSSNTDVRSFTIINELGFTTSCDEISNNSAPTFTYSNVTDYQIYFDTPTYFQTDGACFFKCVLTNGSSSSINFPLSHVSMYLNKTLNRTTPISIQPEIYDVNNNNVKNSTVVIPANGSITLTIGSPTVISLNGSNQVESLNSLDTGSIDTTIYFKSSNQMISIPQVFMQGID